MFDLNELFWLGVVAVLAGSATFTLIYRVAENRRERERLRRTLAGDSQSDSGSVPELLLGPLTPGLAAQVPMAAGTQADIQQELRAAGYYRPTALVEYAALRTTLIVIPLIVTGVLALVLDQEYLGNVLVGGLIAAGLGYSLPRVYLTLRGRARARQIERGLPIAVDMLTLGLSAGQNMQQALQRVCAELQFCHPVLGRELEIVRQQAALRSLPHALQQFAERVQVPEARNLALILIQAERLGTDTSAALLEYAANLRTSLRQRADAQANRTMFWLLFPTLLCLWIPAAILLIAPAVLEFQQHRRSTLQQWKAAREELRNLRDQREQLTPSSPEASSVAPPAGAPATPSRP